MTARNHRKGLWYALALALLPAGLLCALRISRSTADFWSYPLQLGVAVATLAFCVAQVFRSAWPRPLILSLAVSLGLWTLAVATVVIHVTLFNWYVPSTSYTYLLFVSWGIPLLYVAVSYGDPGSSRWQKALDAALLTLLGLLYWLSIRDVLDVHGEVSEAGDRYVRWTFDVESAFLAAAHAFRWLTSAPGATRRFFGITSLFLAGYTGCIGLHNHFLAENDPGWLSDLGDALPPVPFIALLLMLYHYRDTRASDSVDSRLAPRVALGVAPVLFLAAIFALGYCIDAGHALQGLVVSGLAMGVYILRVIQTQYRYVSAQDKLQGMAEVLERLSYTDAVTDLPNRRAFDRAFAREWAASARGPNGISVLMIDIDKFKEYNDLHGHHAGDRCLRAVARLAAGALHRPSDFCGRYGGEEFIIVLPATPLEGAEMVARRIIGNIHAANLPHAKGIDGRVTLSIGVAARSCGDLQAQTLVERADQNLYRAKALGRNRYFAGEPGRMTASLPAASTSPA